MFALPHLLRQTNRILQLTTPLGADKLAAECRSNKTSLAKPFVVGETKSSIFDSLTLIAALPADLKEKFEMLRADEAANPTPNGQPHTFDNADRDALAGKNR